VPLEEDRLSAASVRMAPGDIAVGNASFVSRCVALQGLPKQAAPDYPACLAPLLQRRLWTCTLGEAAASVAAGAEASVFFVKPAAVIKAFSGEEATAEVLGELLTRFPASFPVSCSEKVDIACEHRVYVAHGRVLAVVHCPHPGCERAPPDMAVVEGAVAALQASGEALAGYGIDFCVIKKAANGSGGGGGGGGGGGSGSGLVTALMEVNDGANCGYYDGCSARDYTAMVEARWEQLLAPKEGAGACAGAGEAAATSPAAS